MPDDESENTSEYSLPDGWQEAYYHTEEQEEFTFVTAVYEHIPLKLKTIIVPTYSNARVRLNDAKDAGHTRHSVTHVYPVYKDVGLPSVFSNECSNMRPQIISVVPEVRPRGDDAPNQNAGPYRTHDDGRPRSMIGSERAAEGTFDWEDALPSEAIDAMETYKQFPLDYGPLVENLHTLSTADSLAMAEPDVLPDPFPVSIVVRHSDRANEAFLSTDPPAANRFREKLKTYFDTNAIDLDSFEDGAELATVYVEFQRENFPYDPNLVCIKTPEDAPLPVANRKTRLVNRVKNLVS